VLASADRGPAQRVARSIGVSRPTVWRWQQRFAEAGVEGLLRDQTGKPGKPPIATDKAAQMVALTCTAPPHQSLPQAKRRGDPLDRPVGLYLDPPAHAVVLSLDEKSQIQALDRTQPGLPIKPGRCQTMTHDDKRHSLSRRRPGAPPPCSRHSACSTEPSSAAVCNATDTRSSSVSATPSSARSRPRSQSTRGLDNYATHKHPRSLPPRRRGCWPGSDAIRAGPFTSPQPRPLG
jgi:hypothetical protein